MDNIPVRTGVPNHVAFVRKDVKIDAIRDCNIKYYRSNGSIELESPSEHGIMS